MTRITIFVPAYFEEEPSTVANALTAPPPEGIGYAIKPFTEEELGAGSKDR